MEKIIKPITVFGWAVLFVIASTILYGWVLNQMWIWFIVPVFHTPPLGIKYAVGLSLIVSMLISDKATKSDTKEEEHPVISAALRSIILPLLFLGMAFLVHSV